MGSTVGLWLSFGASPFGDLREAGISRDPSVAASRPGLTNDAGGGHAACVWRENLPQGADVHLD